MDLLPLENVERGEVNLDLEELELGEDKLFFSLIFLDSEGGVKLFDLISCLDSYLLWLAEGTFFEIDATSKLGVRLLALVSSLGKLEAVLGNLTLQDIFHAVLLSTERAPWREILKKVHFFKW